jgi:Fe-S cluster assembly protein SufB
MLVGDGSIGEFYSVAFTNGYQQTDTGTKMVHAGSNTKSQIIAKSISLDYSRNSYRGLVKVLPNAIKTRNYSQCDSLLVGKNSKANTFPYVEIQNNSTKVEHEASTSCIGEEQILYLLQRGLNHEEAISLTINGFCKDVFNKLPFEFASEVNELLNLKVEKTN